MKQHIDYKYKNRIQSRGDTIKRISESSFPGRFVVNGTNKYVTIPAVVIQRMALTPGEYLDVTIRLPKTEKYDEDELMTLSDASSGSDAPSDVEDAEPKTKKTRSTKKKTE